MIKKPDHAGSLSGWFEQEFTESEKTVEYWQEYATLADEDRDHFLAACGKALAALVDGYNSTPEICKARDILRHAMWPHSYKE